jgi:hypothetical protein
MNNILSWADLSKFKIDDIDRVNGINNSYSNLRLFGHSEKEVELIFIEIDILGALTVKKYGYGLNSKGFLTK